MFFMAFSLQGPHPDEFLSSFPDALCDFSSLPSLQYSSTLFDVLLSGILNSGE